MIFLKKNYKKIPRNKKTRKSSRFFNRFIVHRFKAPTGKMQNGKIEVLFSFTFQQEVQK